MPKVWKRLDCGPFLRAASHLGPEDMNRKMIELPGVCALGWAVERMDEQPMPEWGEKRNVGAGPADTLRGH